MKLDKMKSKGMAVALVSCLVLPASMLVGCDVDAVENHTLDVAMKKVNETKNTEEIKEGDTKIFAPGEHMFSELQSNNAQILQYDGYEVFDIEVDTSYKDFQRLTVIYINTEEVEAVASKNEISIGYNVIDFNTPGTPTQKERNHESQKVLTHKI